MLLACGARFLFARFLFARLFRARSNVGKNGPVLENNEPICRRETNKNERFFSFPGPSKEEEYQSRQPSLALGVASQYKS